MPMRRRQATQAWLARHAARYAAAAGLEPGSLLARAGLPGAVLTDEEVRVPLRDQAVFINLVAEALEDDLAGFHIALDFDCRELGSIYYAVASSPSLGEAMAREARAASSRNEGFRVDLRGEAGLGFAFHFLGIERRLDRHLADFAVTAHLRMFRQLTNLQLVPSYVGLVHRGYGDVGEMQRFFGRELVFGAVEDRMVFDPDASNLPLASSDPFLGKLMQKFGAETGPEPRLEDEPVALQVEKALGALLGHGPVRMQSVAARLGYSSRTLARRLTEEGESFADILDRVRRELALHYLTETRSPISQIAWLLGYAEASAFIRAVRRWTGLAPTAVRRRAPSR